MKTLGVIVIALLVILCLSLSFTLFRYNKSSGDSIDQLYKLRNINDLLINSAEICYKYSDMKIRDFWIIDSKNIKTKFSEHLNSKNKLIFKYSSGNCISCIDFELSNVLKFGKLIGFENIIILVEKSNLRELNAFLKERNVTSVQSFLISDSVEDIPMYSHAPMIFIINQNMIMSSVFHPIKELPLYSQQYYSVLAKKYF